VSGLVPLKQDDLEEARRLLRRIHRTADRIFFEGWCQSRADAWFCHDEQGTGVFCTVDTDDFVVCYASYEEDLTAAAAKSDMDAFLQRAMMKRGQRPLFYNLRGDNLSLTKHLRQRGFIRDTLGYELYCDRVPAPPVDLGDLTPTAFDAAHFEAVISLLDGAFNSLTERAGGQRDSFSRGRESLKQRLQEKSDNGDFLSFWLEEILVGVMYFMEDVIEVLAVDPRYQGQGFGALMLSHAVHRLIHECGYPAAYLFVVAENPQAKRFYHRHGFKESGFYDEYTFVGINC
jgi:ribosomal protein S18 acetylase RimI-like enzyme